MNACAACVHWVRKHEGARTGWCRALPPKRYTVQERGGWPLTDQTEGCGAFTAPAPPPRTAVRETRESKRG